MSDVDQKTLRDFVTFCFERRPVAWPSLYDEMCYVAAHKLFRGMGYEELREAGLDFPLSGLHPLARFSLEVVARGRPLGAAAS